METCQCACLVASPDDDMASAESSEADAVFQDKYSLFKSYNRLQVNMYMCVCLYTRVCFKAGK